jgi:hypothetical protein
MTATVWFGTSAPQRVVQGRATRVRRVQNFLESLDRERSGSVD